MKYGFWVSATLKKRSLLFPLHLMALASLLTLLSACGGSGNEPLGGGLALGEVRAIPFDTQGYGNLSFNGNISGEEEYTLALFSAQKGEGTYSVEMRSGNFSESEGESETRLLTSPSSYLTLPEGPAEDPTSWAHDLLRKDEALIAKALQNKGENKFLSPGSFKQNFNIGSPWEESCAGGQGIMVKVLSSLNQPGQFEFICAYLVYQSASVNYYVDEADLSRLPLDLLLPMANEFEDKLPIARELLGAKESDVNEDGRFAVVFTREINLLGSEAGGYITGLFHGVNLLPTDIVPESNEKEIIFVSVPDQFGEYGVSVEPDFYFSNPGPATLIHEYQHMVNYRRVLEGKSPELSSLNEGLSHLLEGVGHGEDPLAEVGIENYSRFAKFLANPNVALTQGTTLDHRGGITLFLRYLCHQANLSRYPAAEGCSAFIQNLIRSDKQGIANLEEATGWSFPSLLTDFYAALILTGQDFGVSDRYEIKGLVYDVDVNDNRGTVLNRINLEQLQQISLDGQVSATGSWFNKFSGHTLKQAGKTIFLQGDPSALLGGVLVRTR